MIVTICDFCKHPMQAWFLQIPNHGAGRVMTSCGDVCRGCMLHELFLMRERETAKGAK